MFGRRLTFLRSKTAALLTKILGPSPRTKSRAAGQPDTSFSLIVRGQSPEAFAATLRSLKRQGDIAFEVILATAGHGPGLRLDALNIPRGRLRGHVKIVPSVDLRAALDAADTDVVILLDAGDELVENALPVFSDHIRAQSCDVVYCDETWLFDGGETQPLLKPSWSPELLTSYDYFGHATAIRRTFALAALQEAEASLPAGTLASEWDLKLRVVARTQAIARIPRVLCRRRFAGGNSPRDVLSADAAQLAPVLAAYWKRQGREAAIRTADDGTFHAAWALHEAPLVSIIIPNKDRSELLRTCVDGLREATDYKAIELIIVDNGSTEPATLALHGEIELKGGRLVAFDEAFNYSRACNRGAAAARGDLLLFLNNDIEVTDSGWLGALVREVMRPGVGIVGPKLLYPDGAIQHAGVAIGLFTLAAHIFHRAPHETWSVFGSPDTQRNCMAVTGACQLVRRSVYDLVGGYDEAYEISHSDIAFCLAARSFGFRTVYVPSSTLVHHEGASRGFTNPTDDEARFARDLRAFGIAEDPYFHPAIYPHSFIPQVMEGDALSSNQQPLKDEIAAIGGIASGQSPRDPLNIWDDGAIAEAIGWDWASVAGPLDSAALAPDLDTAAAILLAFVRRRRDLRDRFPRALSDGAAGGFASWVKTEGLRLLGLGDNYKPWVDAAFAANPGARARQYVIDDAALRVATPLFLLPPGRAATCRSLFAAIGAGKLRKPEVWWFLVESAEDPLRELAATWAISPLWQEKVPNGDTAAGLTRLTGWVAETYGIPRDCLNPRRVPER